MLATVSIGGCADLQGFSALRNEMAGLREDLTAQVRELERARDVIPLGDPRRKPLEAALATTRAQQSVVEAGIAQADSVAATVDEVRDPRGLVGEVIPLLPGPWQAPLVLGSALVVSLVRARRLKKGALSIASSIRKAMEVDPAMREAMIRNASLIRSVQTETASRMIDESDAARRLIRLPV